MSILSLLMEKLPNGEYGLESTNPDPDYLDKNMY